MTPTITGLRDKGHGIQRLMTHCDLLITTDELPANASRISEFLLRAEVMAFRFSLWPGAACVHVCVGGSNTQTDICGCLCCFVSFSFSHYHHHYLIYPRIYILQTTPISKSLLSNRLPPPFRSENCTPDPRPPPADLRPGAFPCEEGLAPPAFLHKNPHSFPILRPRANSYVSSSALLDSFVKMLVKYYEW